MVLSLVAALVFGPPLAPLLHAGPPAPTPPPLAPAAAPAREADCTISGTVTLKREDGSLVPPEGRVVVYVRVVPQELWKPDSHPPDKVLQQKIRPDDFKFSESVKVLVVGDAIDFVNEARDVHNVFSGTDMTFEMPKSTAYSTGTQRFIHPGTYHVQCDIHESMRMDVLAVNNPFFTWADAKGHYQLKPLPAGESYSIVAWERNGHEQEVTVRCPNDKPVDLVVVEAPPPPHRHIDGKPWPPRYHR